MHSVLQVFVTRLEWLVRTRSNVDSPLVENVTSCDKAEFSTTPSLV